MATLECDDVIYHQSYFVFDPEDLRSHQVIQLTRTNSSSVTVPNADGDSITLLTPDIITTLAVSLRFYLLYWKKGGREGGREGSMFLI